MNCGKAISLGNVYLGLMDALFVATSADEVKTDDALRRAVLLFNSLEVLRSLAKSVLSFHVGSQGERYSHRACACVFAIVRMLAPG